MTSTLFHTISFHVYIWLSDTRTSTEMLTTWQVEILSITVGYATYGLPSWPPWRVDFSSPPPSGKMSVCEISSNKPQPITRASSQQKTHTRNWTAKDTPRYPKHLLPEKITLMSPEHKCGNGKCNSYIEIYSLFLGVNGYHVSSMFSGSLFFASPKKC